jgi:sugar lactone lactonase YvrE
MRFYIRKDIAAQIWDYGVAPAPVDQSVQTDPYEGLILSLSPDIRLGMQGSGAGQLNAPRGLAVAPDGSIYVADSKNHRIQRFSPDGEVLNTWGSFADILTGTAPGGTFSEPWGVAVDQDGYVYAADTWNHRIQKFSATGEFVTMWGYFGQGEAPDAFWGPRDVKVDEQGRVYVTDTGNKRVVIFESDGRYINQFGSTGVQPGQYDEPVGISISQDGEIFIADTWNQRVQVVKPDPDRQFFLPESQWEVYGWFGQSLENKPYLTWTRMDHVFVTDPEGYRILEFDTDGKFIRGFSDWAGLQDISSLPAGIVEDGEGRIWISDAGSGTLLRFTLPPHSQ